jgi:lysophospholipase L1-like esterase
MRHVAVRERKSKKRAVLAGAAVLVAALGGVAAIPGGPRTTVVALIKYRECFISPAPADSRNSTVGFGDSVTIGRSNAFTHLGASDSYFDVLGCDPQSGVSYVANKGIKGNTTEQMLRRLDADVIALKPQRVMVIAGTNDILRAPDLPTIDNLEQMKDRITAAGITPIFGLLPPNNTRPEETMRLNTEIRSWATRERVQLIDYWTPLSDATGHYRPGLSQEDGVHPSVAGAHVMAETAKSALARL